MAKGFDLRTHARDKHGKVKSKNPYRLRIVNGEMKFERPPGSGNYFYLNGEEVPKPPAPAAPESKKVEAPKKPEPKLEKKEEASKEPKLSPALDK